MNTYFPDAYGGPKLDYSGIQKAASGIAGGLTEMWDSKSVRNAWAESGGDYNEAIKRLLAAGDVDGANAVAKIQRVAEGDQSRFGLQPIWDQEGNAYQLNSAGGAQRIEGSFPPRMNYVQTPQGVYPMPIQGGMPQQPQAGGTTHPVYGSPEEAATAPDQGLSAPQYGQPIPKNYKTPQEQKTAGEIAEKARAALPAAEGMAERVIGAINRVSTSPNLPNVLGGIQSRLPTFGGDNAAVEADIDQAIGGTFTSVYESLRGAQAITDVEGEKATAAITRLQNKIQSPEKYKEALNDAKYEVFELANTVRKKAGQAPLPNPYPKPRGAPGTSGENRTSRGIQWSIEP